MMLLTLAQTTVIVLCISTAHAQSAPTHCSYSGGVFECDYRLMTDPADRPIDFLAFSPDPQNILLKVDGPLPYIGEARTFSDGFGSISTSNFDNNYPASLTLDCGQDGSLFLSSGAFANMSYIQHLKIKNCLTYYIPPCAFEDLVSLDFFSFEGGQINDVGANAMSYLSVEKSTPASHMFPKTLGHFEVKNTKFNSTTLPPGFLFGWKNLTSVTFRNTYLSTIGADTFRYAPKLRYIDLSGNQFTSLPSGVFDDLTGLSELHLYNINWDCACENIWWYGYAKENNITIFGELTCATPAGTRVAKYWYEHCVHSEPCGDQIGIAWKAKNHCFTMFSLLLYGLALSIIPVTLSLVLVIDSKRKTTEKIERKGNPKKEWDEKRKASRFKTAVSSLPFV